MFIKLCSVIDTAKLKTISLFFKVFSQFKEGVPQNLRYLFFMIQMRLTQGLKLLKQIVPIPWCQ